MHQARYLPVGAFEEGNPLPRTGFQLQQQRWFFHRSSVSRANFSGHVYLTPTYDAACSFVSSGAFCTVSGMYLVGWDRVWFTYRLQTLSAAVLPTVLDVLSTVSARAGYRCVCVSCYARFTRVRSNNLSTQLRRTRTSSTVSPPLPTTVVDPEQTADSEQIRVATIALHTEMEKTRNLQKAQVSQRWTLSFLPG